MHQRLVTCLVALMALSAQAQSPSEKRLYLGTGVLLGSPRVVGLGGAYTAIAEGPSGFASNLAAIAQRAPDLDRNWDLGVAFNWVDLPVTSPYPRDLDNDGQRDQARHSTQYLVGLFLQYQRFGVGTYLRSNTQAYCLGPEACAAEDLLTVQVQHTALSFAWGVGREDLILGFGFYAADVGFAYHGDERRYSGTGLEVDALYRPQGMPWRVGLSIKPELTGALPADAPRDLAGRALFQAVVSPAVVSLGVSHRFGPGAENYNRLSPAARNDLSERFGADSLPPEVPSGAPNGRWLLTAQLDVLSRAERATSISALLRPGELPEVGSAMLFVPRVGVEHETLPGRLRTRAGAFLEASPFDHVLPRAHVTGGAELFVLRYLEDWSLTASFDVARRYSYFSVGIGVWR